MNGTITNGSALPKASFEVPDALKTLRPFEELARKNDVRAASAGESDFESLREC